MIKDLLNKMDEATEEPQRIMEWLKFQTAEWVKFKRQTVNFDDKQMAELFRQLLEDITTQQEIKFPMVERAVEYAREAYEANCIKNKKIAEKRWEKHRAKQAKQRVDTTTSTTRYTTGDATTSTIIEENRLEENRLEENRLEEKKINKFDIQALWEIYPDDKKTNKQGVKKVWDKYGIELQKEILDYVPKYIQCKGKYTKGIMKFLKERTWEDEIVDYTKSTKQQQPFKTARQIDEEEQHRRKVEYDYVDYLIAKGLELPKASALTALVAKTWDFLNGFPPEDPQEVLTAIEAGQPILKLAWSAAK